MAASSSLDSQIMLWDLQDGNPIRTINAGPVECWTVTFSPDGKHLASGTHSGNVNIWSVDSGEKVAVFETRGRFAMAVAYVLLSSLHNLPDLLLISPHDCLFAC